VPIPSFSPQIVPNCSIALNKSDFLRKWLPEIDRAARFRVWAGNWKFSDIEDLKQEIALRFLQTWRQLASRPDAYVRKAIRNTTLNLIRDQRRDPLSAVPDCRTTVTEVRQLEEATDADFLDQLVEEKRVTEWALKLPHTLGQVFQLLYKLDYSQREAATVIGLSQQRIAQYHNKLIKLAENSSQGLPNRAV
jgi:RNA polymerase sigma factor (sigma-70 family)